MNIKTFFHENTNTFTYVVYDFKSKDAVLFDSVLDYSIENNEVSHSSAFIVKDFLDQYHLNLHFIIDTHIHADHLSALDFFKFNYPKAKTVISSGIKKSLETFSNFMDIKSIPSNGSQFDLLINDEQVLKTGTLNIQALHTPGHTPTCTCFLINQSLLITGDTIFQPTFGTGRCDFPNGCATDLYHSITKVLYKLPDETRVYVGHDYPKVGNSPNPETTIEELKQSNIHINNSTSLHEFIGFRTKKDAQLNEPKLLHPSVQFNLNAGQSAKNKEFYTTPCSHLKLGAEFERKFNF